MRQRGLANINYGSFQSLSCFCGCSSLGLYLIKVIMARMIGDYANILKSQPIVTLQIDLYNGPEMTFANTMIRQQLKLIAPNLAPTINQHPHPQNAITACPFAIINGRHLRDKEATYKLLLTLIDLSRERLKQEEEQGENYRRGQQNNCILQSVLQLCEELSEVATVLNEDDSNPFYVFLNPLMKWREHRKLTKAKHRLQAGSQFFNSNEEINQDYLIYRLGQLENYVIELQKKPLLVYQRKFITICLIAMLKHFQANSQMVFKLATAYPLFQKVDQNKLGSLIQLNEMYERAVEQKRSVASFYGMFRLADERVEKKEEQQPEAFKERIYRAMVKPVTVTCVVLVLMRLF